MHGLVRDVLAHGRFLGRGAPTSADGEGAYRGATLSPRESDVVRLLARGRTNAQIATELAITEATVARHVHNIFVKLDCANRAEAAAWAARNGVA